MKTNREVLENELYLTLQKYNSDKKIIQQVNDELLKRNIVNTQSIFKKLIAIDSLNLNELLLLTKTLFNAIRKDELNPANYFTELELKEADKYVNPIKTDSIYPIVIEDVTQDTSNVYSTHLDIASFIELYNKGVIIYNPETQREKKIVKHKDIIIEKTNVNKKSVKEIADRMSTGRFKTNTVTLNILQDDENREYEYNQKDRTLILYSGVFDILDGFHRSLGMMEAIRINPNCDYVTKISITAYNTEDAKDFIVQEDKKNKIDKRYISSLEEKLENNIVKRLNEGNCELKGKITTNTQLINGNMALVMFDTLADSIKDIFVCKTRRDANNIADYLIEFFNELIGLKYEDFVEDLKISKTKNVIAFNNMFAGYVALAKMLQDKNDWKKQLENIINKIDFDINNEVWRDLKIINEYGKSNKEITKTSIKNISKYFENLL